MFELESLEEKSWVQLRRVISKLYPWKSPSVIGHFSGYYTPFFECSFCWKQLPFYVSAARFVAASMANSLSEVHRTTSIVYNKLPSANLSGTFSLNSIVKLN